MKATHVLFQRLLQTMEDVAMLDMDNPFQKNKIHYNMYFNFATCYGCVCCSLEATRDYED